MEMKLSVVIPCYNEKATVQALLRRVVEAPLPKGISGMEILVIDDFSRDGTRDVLQRILTNPQTEIGLKSDQEFQVVLQRKNAGKGHALRSGFQVAKGDIVLIQDADL